MFTEKLLTKLVCTNVVMIQAVKLSLQSRINIKICIIGPLFVKRSSTKSRSKSMSLDKTDNTSQYKGEGFMDLNLEKPNFIYWDDPNELVNRLRLLISSTMAGHSGHNNEISSIIEELREANIIY